MHKTKIDHTMKRHTIRISTLIFLIFFVLISVKAQDYSTGLVAHYEFENITGPVIDAAGTHHGENNEATRGVPGKMGNAFSFDGDDLVAITNHSDISNFDEFTLAAWVKPTYLSRYNCIISKVHTRDFVFRLDQVGYQAHFHDDTDYRGCKDYTPIPLNEWIHLLSTWSNNQWKLYKNGVLVKTCDHPGTEPTWTSDELYIGSLTAAAGNEGFSGTIDEVRIYNRALTEADVNALYGFSNNANFISIKDTAILEESGNASFIITLEETCTETVTGSFSTSDGSAIDGDDYIAQNDTFTISIGESSTLITIPVINDNDEETEETFSVTLNSVSNATLLKAAGTCTILSNDFALLSVRDTVVTEDEGNSIFSISLNKPSFQTINVKYQTLDGTAINGNDYWVNNDLLVINPGDTIATVVVPIIDDSIEEDDEYFSLRISDPVNVVIANDTGICTIIEDDFPILTVRDTFSKEEDEQATFTISLDRISIRTVTGNYTTINGSANDTTDFLAQTGTFTIIPGDISTFISIPITDDIVEETDETFIFVIDNLVNTNVLTDTAICTILASDLATISINDTTVLEDEGQVTFTISIDRPSLQTISGTYTTSNGTAQAGSDYTATSNTFNINPGNTSTTVSVEIVDDLIEDNDEYFSVALSDPIAATIADTFGNCTILDMNCTLVFDCPVTSVNNDTGDVMIDLFINENELSITNGNAVQLPLGESSFWELNGSDIVQIGSGNVGIGTLVPDQKLTVKGNIHAEEVIVDLSVPGPDYVFEKDYKLRTIKELEKFLNKRKHLPEIPPAVEMEDKGINLSVMNIMLLKRIEELTLYIIDQEKRINSLENNTNPKTN